MSRYIFLQPTPLDLPERCRTKQRAAAHVREFIAHGEQWQAIRHPSRTSDPSLFLDRLLGQVARVGLLFVSETGERRFLFMTLDDFPTGAEFDRLTQIDLVGLLERAVSGE